MRDISDGGRRYEDTKIPSSNTLLPTMKSSSSRSSQSAEGFRPTYVRSDFQPLVVVTNPHNRNSHWTRGCGIFCHIESTMLVNPGSSNQEEAGKKMLVRLHFIKAKAPNFPRSSKDTCDCKVRATFIPPVPYYYDEA